MCIKSMPQIRLTALKHVRYVTLALELKYLSAYSLLLLLDSYKMAISMICLFDCINRFGQLLSKLSG